MKRIINILLLFVLAGTVCAAQNQVTIEHEYTRFEGISSPDHFKITVVPSTSYSVQIIADGRIEDYIKSYVKGGVLNLEIDSKAMPKELKSEFRSSKQGLNTPEAIISMPELASIELSGNSTLKIQGEEWMSVDKIDIELSNSAAITNARIATKKFAVNMSNKSSVLMDVETTSASINATHNADADINISTSSLSVNASSFATVDMKGEFKTISINSEGNASVNFTSARL